MSAAKAKPAKVMAAKEGVIVDRGYQPYRGSYTPEAGRWKVIAARMLRMSARQWWAILLLIANIVPLLISGVSMFIMSRLAALAAAQGMTTLPPGVTDPDSYIMFPMGTMTIAFLLALFAGGGQVADDIRAGAFQFYFARPLTREQYLVGKIVAVLSLVLFVTLLPSLLLACLRLALLPSGNDVLHKLPLVGAALVSGCIEAVVLAVPAVAFSSLSRRRSLVQGGFAILYLLPWVVGVVFAKPSQPWPAVLSIPAHLENIGRFLFRFPLAEDARTMPVWLSAAFLAALVAGSLALLRKRLAAVEVVAS